MGLNLTFFRTDPVQPRVSTPTLVRRLRKLRGERVLVRVGDEAVAGVVNDIEYRGPRKARLRLGRKTLRVDEIRRVELAGPKHP